MFTNLNIETQREVPQAISKGTGGANAAAQQDPNAPQPEVVTFTIKCNYARPASQQNASSTQSAPTNHVAKNQ